MWVLRSNCSWSWPFLLILNRTTAFPDQIQSTPVGHLESSKTESNSTFRHSVLKFPVSSTPSSNSRFNSINLSSVIGIAVNINPAINRASNFIIAQSPGLAGLFHHKRGLQTLPDKKRGRCRPLYSKQIPKYVHRCGNRVCSTEHNRHKLPAELEAFADRRLSATVRGPKTMRSIAVWDTIRRSCLNLKWYDDPRKDTFWPIQD